MNAIIEIDNYTSVVIDSNDREIEIRFAPVCKECGGEMWNNSSVMTTTGKWKYTYKCKDCEREKTVDETRLIKHIILEKKI